MTELEAIEIIKVALAGVEWDWPPDVVTALVRAVDALNQLKQIKSIVNSPVYIQEDVLRYKMICEVLKREGKDDQPFSR